MERRAIPGGGSVTITITATINALPATPVSEALTVSNQGTINSDADGNGTNETTTLTSAAEFSLVLPIPTVHTTVFVMLAVLLALTGFVFLRRRTLA